MSSVECEVHATYLLGSRIYSGLSAQAPQLSVEPKHELAQDQIAEFQADLPAPQAGYWSARARPPDARDAAVIL